MLSDNGVEPVYYKVQFSVIITVNCEEVSHLTAISLHMLAIRQLYYCYANSQESLRSKSKIVKVLNNYTKYTKTS